MSFEVEVLFATQKLVLVKAVTPLPKVILPVPVNLKTDSVSCHAILEVHLHRTMH